MLRKISSLGLATLFAIGTQIMVNAQVPIEVTGHFVLNHRGELVLEHDSGKHYMLFDEKNKDQDMTYYKYFMYMEEDLAKQVIDAKKAKKRVTAKGTELERVGMPDGILLGDLMIHE